MRPFYVTRRKIPLSSRRWVADQRLSKDPPVAKARSCATVNAPDKLRKGGQLMSLAEVSEWTVQAKCRDMADALFPEGRDQKRARSVCVGCPVRSECLAEALDNRIEWGVWGGMTERERRALLRQRPDIDSWYDVLVNYNAESNLTVVPVDRR